MLINVYYQVPMTCGRHQIQINEFQGPKSKIASIQALMFSQWPELLSSEDAELSIWSLICSSMTGCRKCSPQLQTLKPNESNIMSLTCHWLKPRRDAVGSMLLLLLKSCLRFLLFCCWRHFNRLSNTAFSNKSFPHGFPVIWRFTDKISSSVLYLPKVKQVIKIFLKTIKYFYIWNYYQ